MCGLSFNQGIVLLLMNGGISMLSLYVAAIAEEEEDDVELPGSAGTVSEDGGSRPSSLPLTGALASRTSSVARASPEGGLSAAINSRSRLATMRNEGADSDDDDDVAISTSNPVIRHNDVEMIAL